MSDIWGSLKGLLNLNAKKIYIDNVGFRLHYKVTTVILVAFGILVTSRQYFGDPIDCITHSELIKPIVDTFCWIHGTFTLRQGDSPKYSHLLGVGGPKELENFPGTIREESKRDYASYYQWVWIVLLLQAACFYVPHWIWKTWEGGRIKALIGDLNSHVMDDTVKSKHQAAILQYFKPQSGIHKVYAVKYFLCEILCLVNVIVQILLTNSFIGGGQFLKYGLNIFKERPYYTADDEPMLKVFPVVSYCVLPVNGFVAEKPVLHEAYCILPINILNQKIYMFLWLWLVFMSIVSALGIIYRVITAISPTVRKWRLKSFAKSLDGETIDVMVANSDIGDWFFLYELGRNMNPIYFAELLKDLSSSWSKMQSSKSSLLPY